MKDRKQLIKEYENVFRHYWQMDVDEEGYNGSFAEWLHDPENESEISTVIEFGENNI